MKQVWRDISRYVSAELFMKLISMASFLYVGKILLPDEFGYYAMALLVISLGSSLGEFGGASLILRDYHAKGLWSLIRALPITLGAWLLMSGVILMAGSRIWQWNPAFAALNYHPYLMIGLLLINPLNTLLGSFLIVSLHAGFYSANVVAKSIIHTILLVVLVSFHPSYVSQLYATFVGDLVCLCIPIICFRNKVANHALEMFSREVWRPAIRQIRAGFVFFSKELMSVFQVYLSRLIVSAYLPIAALGIYSFFFSIAVSLSFLIVAVDRVYTPRMIKMYGQDPDRHRTLLSGLISVTALVSVTGYLLIIAVGEVGLYRLLLRNEYTVNSHMLNGLLFLLVPSSLLQVISFSYYIGENNNSIQKQAFLSLMFLVILQLVLVPRYGLSGAVVAEVLASGFRLCSLCLLNGRILRLGIEPFSRLMFLVLFCAAVVSLSLLRPSMGVESALLIAVGIGIYAYASVKNVQQVYRWIMGGGRLATTNDTVRI